MLKKLQDWFQKKCLLQEVLRDLLMGTLQDVDDAIQGMVEVAPQDVLVKEMYGALQDVQKGKPQGVVEGTHGEQYDELKGAPQDVLVEEMERAP